VVPVGVTKEQYDQVRAEVGWLDEGPVGGLSHVTWWEGGDCHNADAWESEAAFNYGAVCLRSSRRLRAHSSASVSRLR
jgi:hypothetical protein